ncbi:MAG: hypothetical protein ABI588_06935, partial [Arenimonas sp.]
MLDRFVFVLINRSRFGRRRVGKLRPGFELAVDAFKFDGLDASFLRVRNRLKFEGSLELGASVGFCGSGFRGSGFCGSGFCGSGFRGSEFSSGGFGSGRLGSGEFGRSGFGGGDRFGGGRFGGGRFGGGSFG